MINNSFYINVQRGTIGGCEHERQTLYNISDYRLNREGDFYIKYLILSDFLTFN